jgi:hypothetical protein
MTEWQPIATLPEDAGWGGSDVVLWNPCDGLDVPPFAEPRDVYDKIREGKGGYTHWRRLDTPRGHADDTYYRPPATYRGSESLEAQLTRKRSEPPPPSTVKKGGVPPPSLPFPTGNPPPWLAAVVMGGTFLCVGLAVAYAIISRG